MFVIPVVPRRTKALCPSGRGFEFIFAPNVIVKNIIRRVQKAYIIAQSYESSPSPFVYDTYYY